jgi:hypothetical protein
MKTAWIDKTITYDGTQLRSHWIHQQSGTSGDVVAAFIGPADVPLANMVDLADVAASSPIFSRSMLHFLVEHFDTPLTLAVARQRLLMAIAAEEINRTQKSSGLERKGDDLYVGDRKLSVSIATASPVSSLIHVGMNIVAEGAPVPAIGLEELGVAPKSLAQKVLNRYSEEIHSMRVAICKVRPVP